MDNKMCKSCDKKENFNARRLWEINHGVVDTKTPTDCVLRSTIILMMIPFLVVVVAVGLIASTAIIVIFSFPIISSWTPATEYFLSFAKGELKKDQTDRRRNAP